MVRPISPSPFDDAFGNPPDAPVEPSATLPISTWKWAGAWLGTWLVLAAVAEMPQTSDLAAALAITIAFSVSMVILPKAKDVILHAVG